MTNNAVKRALPLSPHPDHLRKEAKTRLAGLKDRIPTIRLTDVQLILAREYGFANWGQLRAEVARRSGQGRRLRGAVAAALTLRRIPADADTEGEPAFFRAGLIAQVGFIIVALTGVAMVIATNEKLHGAQAVAGRLALLIRTII
jgi:hypothetical protein